MLKLRKNTHRVSFPGKLELKPKRPKVWSKKMSKKTQKNALKTLRRMSEMDHFCHLFAKTPSQMTRIDTLKAVLAIRIWISLDPHFLGLKDPDLDPLFCGSGSTSFNF